MNLRTIYRALQVVFLLCAAGYIGGSAYEVSRGHWAILPSVIPGVGVCLVLAFWCHWRAEEERHG